MLSPEIAVPGAACVGAARASPTTRAPQRTAPTSSLLPPGFLLPQKRNVSAVEEAACSLSQNLPEAGNSRWSMPGKRRRASSSIRRGFQNSVTSEFSPYRAFVLGVESLCFEGFLRVHPVLQQGISPRFGSNTAGVQESASAVRRVGGCDFEGRRPASARRIHALMPTGHRRGQALRTVPTRSFAEQCVESHTWPPLSATERRPMTLNCRPPGHEKRALDDNGVCPACLLTVIHTPPNPYTLDGWLPMRPGWWGDDGWRNPTDLPQLRRTRAAAEAAARGQTERTAT